MNDTLRMFPGLFGLLVVALPQVGCGGGGVASDTAFASTDDGLTTTGTTGPDPGTTTRDETEGTTTSWPTTGDPVTTDASTTDASTTDASETDGTGEPETDAWLIRAAGGNLSDSVKAVELAPGGALMLAGYVMGEDNAYFFGDDDDPGQISFPVDATNQLSGFLSRYNTDGSIVWTELMTSGEGAQIVAMTQVEGGVVVVGSFAGEVRLGAGQAGETVLQSRGAYDALLARYDLSGALVWATQIGGPVHEYGQAVTALADGSFVVVGRYADGAVFGAGPAAVTLSSQGDEDLFVARYSSAGELLWVRSAGGASDDQATGVAALPDGGVVITGSFRQTLNFDQPGPNQTLQSVGDRDVVTAKFSADGERLWAIRAGGAEPLPALGDHGQMVAPLADDGVLVCGEFYAPDAAFEGEDPETEGGGDVEAGEGRLFLARLDASTGALEWVKTTKASGVPGAGGHQCRDVLPREDGGFLLVGGLLDSSIFGPGEAQETTLTASGYDVLVASFAADGALEWAKNSGGNGFDRGEGAVWVGGDLVVVGSLTSASAGHAEVTLDFDGGPADPVLILGMSDGFALRFTP